jgi:outer membrane receptor protein involved in Fe transport
MNDINDAFNIPKWTFNAVVGYDILKNLRVHGHVCVETEQTNYTLSMNAAKPQITSSKVPARAIVDLGVRYGLGRLEFGVNCHNLLNQKYYRGCFGAGLIRQPSFSVLGYVAVKI